VRVEKPDKIKLFYNREKCTGWTKKIGQNLSLFPQGKNLNNRGDQAQFLAHPVQRENI
jgi:hypothetical protein